MTETKTSAALGDQTGEPAPEPDQVQQARLSQAKTAPPPVQRVKPGRKPLFRN